MHRVPKTLQSHAPGNRKHTYSDLFILLPILFEKVFDGLPDWLL